MDRGVDSRFRRSPFISPRYGDYIYDEAVLDQNVFGAVVIASLAVFILEYPADRIVFPGKKLTRQIGTCFFLKLGDILSVVKG